MKLFDADMPFFKGNTHMHTTLSDGELSPEDACARYAEAGYDFVVVDMEHGHGGISEALPLVFKPWLPLKPQLYSLRVLQHGPRKHST